MKRFLPWTFWKSDTTVEALAARYERELTPLRLAALPARPEFLFLATDDFDRDHAAYTAAGVTWVRPPAVHDYGTVAVFEDLYGNRWDLVQFSDGR